MLRSTSPPQRPDSLGTGFRSLLLSLLFHALLALLLWCLVITVTKPVSIYLVGSTAADKQTNSVDVERSGGTLTLKYRLVDSIGNEYASMNNRRDNPPVFAVYKGDKQVGSGKFEYG